MFIGLFAQLSGGRLRAQGVYEESASAGLERRPDDLPESGEAPWRNVGEPEAKADHVVTVFGAPVEKVSPDVADGRLGVGFPESGAVDVEHLWRVVDGGYGVCMTDELDRPQAGTSRELEHVASGAERVELPSDLLKLGEPPAVPLGAAVVASLAWKPFVVLAGACRVIGELAFE